MVKLKLTLNSSKPNTVYASNGKSYRLEPGFNTLSLSYDDYVALANALSIIPVSNTKDAHKEPDKVAEDSDNVTTNDNQNESELNSTDSDNTTDNENQNNSESDSTVNDSNESNESDQSESHSDDLSNECDDTHSDSAVNNSEQIDQSSNESELEATKSVDDTYITNEELDKESEQIDYTTWSYANLKAEYKSITGSSCRLKKDEIIAFLQEHKNA